MPCNAPTNKQNVDLATFQTQTYEPIVSKYVIAMMDVADILVCTSVRVGTST